MVKLEDNLNFDDVIYPQNYNNGKQLVDDVMARVNKNYQIAQAQLDVNLQQLQNTLQQEAKSISENSVYGSNHYSDIEHDTNFVKAMEAEQSTEVEQTEVEQPTKVEQTEVKQAEVEQTNVEQTDVDKQPFTLNDEDEENLIKRLSVMAETSEFASNELGVINYLNGNIDQAVEYFEKSSQMGYSVAKRNLAIALENNNSEQDTKIFALYKEASEANDMIALNNLGCCYLTGDGTEEDVKKAIQCFEKASEMGDELSKINLADCYAIGNGVRQNYNKAYKLYKDASELGNPVALKRLAECYLNGQGVTQNFRNALECYHKAALKGDDEAQRMFDKLAEKSVATKHLSVDDNVKREIPNVDEKLAQATEKAKERNEQNNAKDKNRQEPVI